MATSKYLMLAILSMDSYNEGYGAGLLTGNTQIGSATLNGAADGIPTDATLRQKWIDSGFYAAAYTWDGKTVISYRGTDNFGADPVKGGDDIVNGWTVATGKEASQVNDALAFYKSVTGYSVYDPNPEASKFFLTGHSLGGGLACFVS